jgi:hypothetical protein
VALSPTAAWTKAANQSPNRPRVLVEIYNGTDTWKVVDKPCQQLAYSSALIGVSSIAEELDPFYRAVQASTVVITVSDAWARQVVVNNRLKGQRVRISLGWETVAESDFLRVFTGTIESVSPRPGANEIEMECLSTIGWLESTPVVGYWNNDHPLEAIETIFTDAGLSSAQYDGDAFDPSDASNAAISHYVISRGVWPGSGGDSEGYSQLGTYRTQRGWVGNYSAGQMLVRDGIPALELVNELACLLNGQIRNNEDGEITFSRFDSSGSAVDHWSQEIYTEFSQRPLDENVRNRITVAYARHGGSDYHRETVRNDTDSQASYAYPGESERIIAERIETPWLDGTDLVSDLGGFAGSLTTTTNTTLVLQGPGASALTGTRVPNGWPSSPQASDAQLSASRPAYFLIDDQMPIIWQPNFTGVGLDDLSSGGTYEGTADTTIEVEITATGTPDTYRWRQDGGAWDTGNSASTSAVELVDGITITFGATTGHTVGDLWTILAEPNRIEIVKSTTAITIDSTFFCAGMVEDDPSAAFPNHSVGPYPYKLTLTVARAQFGTTAYPHIVDADAIANGFWRVRDITQPVDLAEARLKRFGNGAPVVELKTPLHKAWIQYGDFVTLDAPDFVGYGYDGIDQNDGKWEVAMREIAPHDAEPGIKWVLVWAAEGSPTLTLSNAQIITSVNLSDAVDEESESGYLFRPHAPTGWTTEQVPAGGLQANISPGDASSGTKMARMDRDYKPTFTASKDTYVSWSMRGRCMVFRETALAAGRPTYDVGEFEIAKVVTDATDVTSIDQSELPTKPFSVGKIYNPAFSVYRNSAWTVPKAGGGSTTVPYDTANYDDGPLGSANVNLSTGTFTVPTGEGGVYNFSACAGVTALPTGYYFKIDLYVGGALTLEGDKIRNDSGSAQDTTVTGSFSDVTLSDADAVTIKIYTDYPTANLNGQTGSTITYFSGRRVR